MRVQAYTNGQQQQQQGQWQAMYGNGQMQQDGAEAFGVHGSGLVGKAYFLILGSRAEVRTGFPFLRNVGCY